MTYLIYKGGEPETFEHPQDAGFSGLVDWSLGGEPRAEAAAEEIAKLMGEIAILRGTVTGLLEANDRLFARNQFQEKMIAALDAKIAGQVGPAAAPADDFTRWAVNALAGDGGTTVAPPKAVDPRSDALARAIAADKPLDGWAR